MIPFQKTFEFEYGKSHRVSPLIRRVVARNAGRFTGPGTGTFIVGLGRVAIIDPGPAREDHFQALVEAVAGEEVSHVLVTHQHIDHSALGRRLAEHFGAMLCGRNGVAGDEDDGGVREEAGDDTWFTPDLELAEDWRAHGPGWTLRALHTPGHTSGHFCFALEEENALFCGDHVMAWSTSVVSPPDGRMGDYLSHLRRIRDLNFRRLLPTHGPHIDAPHAFIEAYLAHREAREQAIIAQVRDRAASVRSIVAVLYAEVDRALHPAAMHSVLAHLIHLVERGEVVATPAPTIEAHYMLARAALA
jgi:glyoxylase-like metal-dependent hydrolase (beta-lactamase superfamily II)